MRRQTRSGVSGSSFIGTPASATAVAMAADDARERALAAALGPEGPGPVAVLDDDAGRLAGQVLDGRDAVLQQVVVEQQAVLEDHLLEQRVADALHRGALVLALHELGVDGPAHVRDGRRPATVTRPVSRSTLDLRGADADLPEDRPLGVGAGALGVDAALADELPPAARSASR